MKGTILIPIDFTIASLNLLKEALQENKDTKRTYLLVFEMNFGDSITDLLFLSKARLIESCTNETFNEGLDILENRFSDTIEALRIEPFSGFTKAAFKNFVEANQVEEAFVPTKEIISSKHKDLKFICSQLERLNTPSTTVEWDSELEEYSPNTILQLFNA